MPDALHDLRDTRIAFLSDRRIPSAPMGVSWPLCRIPDEQLSSACAGPSVGNIQRPGRCLAKSPDIDVGNPNKALKDRLGAVFRGTYRYAHDRSRGCSGCGTRDSAVGNRHSRRLDGVGTACREEAGLGLIFSAARLNRRDRRSARCRSAARSPHRGEGSGRSAWPGRCRPGPRSARRPAENRRTGT